MFLLQICRYFRALASPLPSHFTRTYLGNTRQRTFLGLGDLTDEARRKGFSRSRFAILTDCVLCTDGMPCDIIIEHR